MNIEYKKDNGIDVAVVSGEAPVIVDPQSALDLAMTVRYETGAERIAIDKSVVCEDFFILSTGMAGEILQKFTNYSCENGCLWGLFPLYQQAVEGFYI